MNHLLSPFANWCCRTGINVGTLNSQFADSKDIYQAMCWIVNYLEHEVIPKVNEDVEGYNNLYAKYVEIKNFVEHYFENLDVQQEINNKLDQMVEDGTLAEIIGEYISNKLTIYAPAFNDRGDLSVYEFKKNDIKKLMIVDFGEYSLQAFTNLKAKLVAKGYTKFDYAIVSHYHGDHVGMLPYMVSDSTFDFSECTFYLPPTPDYQRFIGSTRYIPEKESEIKQLLNNNNIHYNIPTNSTVLTILDDFKIKFYNCNQNDYESYYSATELKDGIEVTKYNNFSIVNTIEFDGKRVLLTGDIEQEAEGVIAEQVKIVPDVLKVEHHAVSPVINTKYLNTLCKAKINFVMLNEANIESYVLNENAQLYHTAYSGDIVITLDNNGVYADSQNGAVASDYNKFKLDNTGIIISANTDLNDINKASDYVCQSSSIASTLSNCPTKYAFRLITISKNYSFRTQQYLFEFATDIVYSRYYNNGTWSNWRAIQNGGNLIELESNSDLDTLPFGDYQVAASVSTTLTLPPELNNKRIKLSVRQYNNDGTSYQIAIGRLATTTNYPCIYYRFKLYAAENYSEWFRIDNTLPLRLNNNDDLNNYKTEGKYYSESGTMTNTLLNKPNISVGFTLEVIKASAIADRYIQRITTLSTNMEIYQRCLTSAGWSNWFKLTTA